VAVAPRAADEDDIVDAIAAIEVRLAAMQRAMLAGDPTAIETEATGLQRALSACAPLLADPRNAQRVPPSTRTMIANVRARTSAQREALARAGAAADRALAVVIGQSQRALYGADGTATPRPAGDLARA
jgi:hypothetical protein